MSFEIDIGKDLEQMVSMAVKRKRGTSKDKTARPVRPDWLSDGIASFSDTVRKNVAAILSVESEVYGVEGLNRSELGRLMGLQSAVIYSILNGRNEIGSAVLVRMSHALGLEPYLLLLPNKQFVKSVIPAYRSGGGAKTASPKRTKRSAEKAS